jgi:GAF domain-containing protein/HAMP domain-containing protein
MASKLNRAAPTTTAVQEAAMVIARKLLIPTLTLSSLLVVALIGYFAWTSFQTLQASETQAFESYNSAITAKIDGIKDLAIGQAKQTASNPAIRFALAERNRELLYQQAQEAYSALRGFYDIRQLQFIDPSSIVILRVQQPDVFGDDISTRRMSIVAANTLKRDVSGLELAEDGLGLRAVVPVFNESTYVGCVDYDVHIGKATLSELKSETGADWQMLILRPSMDSAGFSGEPGMQNGPLDNLTLQVTTLDRPVYAPGTVYEQVMRGRTISSNVEQGNNSYQFLSVPIRDLSGQVVGMFDIILNRTEALAALRNRLWLAFIAGLAGLGVIWGLMGFIIRRTMQPIQDLTQTANAIAHGDLQRQATIRSARGSDEVDQLAHSFNIMTQQLSQSLTGLEQRVADRTRELERRSVQLQAASAVARDVAMTTDLNELLNRAVEIIRQRFDFYHAGVFLIDERGEFAVLRAATGEAGRRMLERNHKLRVGEVGLVGAASGMGQPQIVSDVEESATHYKNPLLPDTRSELAIPLRVTDPIYGVNMIGVLDVQSTQVAAFSPDEVTILQTMADQLAIAINNARLIDQLNRSVQELKQASGQFTQRSWREFTSGQSEAQGYRYTISSSAERGAPERSVQALVGEPQSVLRPEALQAFLQGETIVARPNDGDSAISDDLQTLPGETTASKAALAVPLRLRGQVIGVLNLRFDSPTVPAEVANLAEEIGSRLSLVLEGTRLLYQAQRLAYREQQINWISSQVSSSVHLDTILQNTVRELGKALGASRTYIQIGEYLPTEEPEIDGNQAPRDAETVKE